MNFSNFDNQRGVERFVIPNYVHYIRLNQSYIRWECDNVSIMSVEKIIIKVLQVLNSGFDLLDT